MEREKVATEETGRKLRRKREREKKKQKKGIRDSKEV